MFTQFEVVKHSANLLLVIFPLVVVSAKLHVNCKLVVTKAKTTKSLLKVAQSGKAVGTTAVKMAKQSRQHC